MTIKKVASTAALPDRRDGLKVRVHKTSELIAVLPASVRRLQWLTAASCAAPVLVCIFVFANTRN